MDQHYKVLLVHNKYKLAGGEDTLAVNEAKVLKEHGHTVIEYIRDNHDIDGYSAFHKMLTLMRLIYSRKLYRELCQLIKDEQIQLIHAINIVPLIGFTLYLVAHDMKIPMIQAVNNFRYVCPGGACMRDGKICEQCIVGNSYIPAIRYGCYRKSKIQTICLCVALSIHRKFGTFEKVDRYVVPSFFNKEKLRIIVKDQNKIHVQEPSIPDKFTSLVPAEGRKYYVYAARLEKLKGIQVAIKAFKNLDAKLIVLGTGEDEEMMKQYVADHGMTNVEFVGFKNSSEMREIFRNAKALLYPTQWYEGIPLTLLEAFAQGTPVIGSNMGNVGVCIENGYNGFTFQYDDPTSLRNTVLKFETLCNSDVIYRNARITYETKYTEEVDYCGLLALFQTLIKTYQENNRVCN